MNLRSFSARGPAQILLAVTLLFAGGLLAQEVDIPRTPFGAPDFQGTYNIATVTMLERGEQFGDKLVLTAEEAASLGTTGDSYLENLTENVGGAEGTIGGYNTFWMDPGEQMAVINGEIRSSIIVDPPNGRLPWSAPGPSRCCSQPWLVGENPMVQRGDRWQSAAW